MEILSFISGFILIGLVFISWVMLARLLQKKQRARLMRFLALKYVVLILAIVGLIYFDITNIYFFYGTFAGIIIVISLVLINANKFIKKYDSGK